MKMSAGHRVGLALASAALLAPLACAPGRTPSRPDVVLVTIDRLRWEELSPWGGDVQARTLAGLAAEAVRFETAATPAPGGAPAALTVLTGLLPSAHGVRVLDDGQIDAAAQSLADRLGARGYSCGAFLQTDGVTPFMGADRGFGAWDGPAPGFPVGHPGHVVRRETEPTVASAMHWLTRLPTETPGLAWIHLAEPAVPELSAADRAARLGELDRLLGALVDAARGRGAERRVPPILILCNLSSHGPDPARAAAESFLLDASALRVRLLVSAKSLQARAVPELVGLDETADLAVALTVGGSSRLLDLAHGRAASAREAVIAETLVPWTSCGAEPLVAVVRATGPASGPGDPAALRQVAADSAWPGGHDAPAAAAVLETFLALDGAAALARQGQGARAVEALRTLAERAPGGPPPAPGVLVALGLALAAGGRPGEALSQFEALAQDARAGTLPWLQARFGVALASSAAGDAARARASLEEILAQRRGDLRALTWLATTAERAGDRPGAVAALITILERDPDNPFALATLGVLHLQMGRPREASDALTRALARQPTHPGLLLMAADALASSGDWWSALDRIDTRVQLYGASPETDLATARCWFETGRWEVAAEYFGRYVSARPDDARAQLGLAECLLMSDQEEAGRAAWRRARELTPASGAACDVLRRWVLASGRDMQAELQRAECGAAP